MNENTYIDQDDRDLISLGVEIFKVQESLIVTLIFEIALTIILEDNGFKLDDGVRKKFPELRNHFPDDKMELFYKAVIKKYLPGQDG